MEKLILAAALVFAAGCTSAPPASEAANATQGDGCHSPVGFIPEGRTATGYLHQVESRGQNCQQGVLTCEDGVWSGAYIYPSCVVTP